LEKNIIDNADYCNVEFVILNYGSTDDLDDFIMKDMKQYVDGGILKYFKVDAENYDMSHSRNIAFKLATGDIVNNIDADNFLGKCKDGVTGFASLINKMAEVSGEKALFFRSKRLAHGRLGMWKKDFLEIGGYPEQLADGSKFEGYGWDDKCLTYRCGALGYKMMWFCGEMDVNRIKTSGGDKGKHMKNKNWKETENLNYELTM
jgi:glycosyltransferase involved in cell wall biosynthesis